MRNQDQVSFNHKDLGLTLKTNETKPIYEGASVYATCNTEVEQKGEQEDFQLEVAGSQGT